MKRTALLALALLAPAGAARADMIVNGGFEAPVIANPSFSTFQAIPGWTTAFGPGIEVQNHVAGSPFAGNQFVELDSSANSGMYQDLATVAGQAYRLSFAYSPRPGVAANSTGIDVLWGGSTVSSLALNGVGLSDTAWQVYTLDLTATSSLTRLQFNATGLSDSLGGYIDNVSVNAVPEPSSLALCGLFGLGGLIVRARRRK